MVWLGLAVAIVAAFIGALVFPLDGKSLYCRMDVLKICHTSFQ